MSIGFQLRELFGKKRGRSRSEMQAPNGDYAAWRFAVTLPVNGSHTARYVLLQAVSPRGYPNKEDYILLARHPGELFRPAYMVYVPFDEEPPMLLDCAANPQVAVVYQDFTFAWTDDGGRTVRRPPAVPEGLFELARFGDHRIDWVQVHGEYLYVKMAAGRGIHERGGSQQNEFVADKTRVWRIRLDGCSDRAELVQPPVPTLEAAVEAEILVEDGSRLVMRASPESSWVEVPPETLLEQLREAKVDFFGGTGARYLPGPL